MYIYFTNVHFNLIHFTQMIQFMTSIAQKIIKLREKQGLTQTDFAKKIGVSRSTIAKLETEQTGLSKKLLNKILDRFPNEIELIDNIREDLKINLPTNDYELSINDKKFLNDNYISYEKNSILYYYLNLSDKELDKLYNYYRSEIKDKLLSMNNLFEISRTLKFETIEDLGTKFSYIENIDDFLKENIRELSLLKRGEPDNKKLINIRKIIHLDSDSDHYSIMIDQCIHYLKSFIDMLIDDTIIIKRN